MIYAFIRSCQGEHPVALLCRVLGVSRSGYYAEAQRPESARQQADSALTELIRQAHTESRGTYGAPRVHAALRSKGRRCSRKRVARLMRQAGLRGAMPPRGRRKASEEEAGTPATDLLAVGPERYAPGMPARLWCADMKQIWTQEGWLHLAAVQDLGSRRIVGHACGSGATAELAQRAFLAAWQRTRPQQGLIHHSDRGSAYRSAPFQALLQRHEVCPSMSRPATPQDNATVESFFSCLERECLQGRRFASRRELRGVLFDYIEVFYNRQRLHSSLGYRSPVIYEACFPSEGLSTQSG